MLTILGHNMPDLNDKETDEAIDICNNFSAKRAIWSILETVSIMDQVAVEGKGLKLSYNIHWGEIPITVTLPDNPTWRDLFEAGDKAIVLSGDRHHVFIEDFEWVAADELEMTTGS
jgi:hypothetical protein